MTIKNTLKSTLKEWPPDGNTVRFEELTEPCLGAILMSQICGKSDNIPWNGLTLGNHELVTCFNPAEALEAKNRNNKEGMHIIVSLAVQLGIEQGRRLQCKKDQSILLAIKSLVNLLIEK